MYEREMESLYVFRAPVMKDEVKGGGIHDGYVPWVY